MRSRFFIAMASALLVVMAPHAVQAISPGDPGFHELDAIYYTRPDLQQFFSEQTWRAVNAKTAPYPTLIAWAQQAGYLEYPSELITFAPKGFVPSEAAYRPKPNLAPKKKTSDTFASTNVTAKAIYVVDVASETPLLSIDENTQYPVASLSKLMTAMVTVERGVKMSKTMALVGTDEVGGARINFKVGARLSMTDLFYAMLVGSANNAANAVARSTGLEKPQFVTEMNAKAKAFGLSKTTFVDPTGIEPTNISTAREMALIALRAYELPAIKRATTTAQYRMAAAAHTIKNTNGLLLDNTNGLYVLGGKTGYLPEVGWNLAVKMRDEKQNHPLLVMVMGSGDRPRSFEDAETVARWVWANYQWN